MSAKPSIVIIGGGFAGAALAYHLLLRPSPLWITIIERGPQLGRGLAYAAQSGVLRLNVPASRMSLDPAKPNDFVQFANCEASPEAFLPRRHYGDYVQAGLARAMRAQPERLNVLRGEVISIAPDSVTLSDGRCVAADRIVLATGHAAMSGAFSWPDDERVVDAWDEQACVSAARSGRLLVVGAGLSCVDALLLFASAQHDDKVTVLSRHGLLPRPHAAHGGSFQIPSRHGPAPTQLRELVHWIRELVEESEHNGCPWQHCIDALRPHLPRLWQQLSTRDRVRFVRLVRPYWDVLRHRSPMNTLAAIEAQRANGEVEVLAGRVLECHPQPNGLDVTLRLRGGAYRIERFSRIIRCLGSTLTVDSQATPVLAALLSAGLAQRDPARLGIVTLEHGRLIDGLGRPSRQLFAIGQPCRASRWETTSVPEIVRDAVAMAQLFTAEAAANDLRSTA